MSAVVQALLTHVDDESVTTHSHGFIKESTTHYSFILYDPQLFKARHPVLAVLSALALTVHLRVLLLSFVKP